MARDISSNRPAGKRSLLPMLLVFLCSLAPIVGAVVVYMNPQWWPAESSNYGALIEPQRPMPAAGELRLTTLDGRLFDLQSLKGKWLLVAADGGACPDSCARKLFITRNSHASQGKNVERLARIWFITDDAPVPEKVLEAYKGTVMVRADPDQLARFLLARERAAGQPGLQDPIWVIDPLGNLMMQFPAEADGVKVRKDISKLVYNSRVG
ncbi:hypothetical protein [Achromobacter sp. HZ01]|uniref:SCO family protein n=1 Tax=Achromobacter sp. HZ01 TaxID=1416886 RepID=UPI001AEF6462|nr:hypothetical protein [Achromobacter sp. HZ01]